jgi:hypothetical protein
MMRERRIDLVEGSPREAGALPAYATPGSADS